MKLNLTFFPSSSFTHPFSHVPTDGSHASFDTSIETASFLSGNETLDDILSEPGTGSGTFSCSSAIATITTSSHSGGGGVSLSAVTAQHLAAAALTDVTVTPHPAPSRTPSLPSDDGGEFPCSHCEKKFGNRRNLLSHMRRHTGDFKLFCESCGKGFFTQSKLDSHKRKHTGILTILPLFKPGFISCTSQNNLS